jgi:DEAD_2
VVSELKKTSYKPSMAILGSKSHYCIHDKAIKGDVSVDEACEQLLDTDQGCAYKNGVPRFLPYVMHTENVKVRTLTMLCPPAASPHPTPVTRALSASVSESARCAPCLAVAVGEGSCVRAILCHKSQCCCAIVSTVSA